MIIVHIGLALLTGKGIPLLLCSLKYAGAVCFLLASHLMYPFGDRRKVYNVVLKCWCIKNITC